MAQRLHTLFIYFLCSALFLVFLAPGCKKDEPMPTSPNSENFLGTWTLKEEVQDQNNDGNFVSVLDQCDLDDTWAFTDDGKLFVDKKGTTCDPIPPINTTLNWELQDNETVLYLHSASGFDKYKIFELDDKILVLHRPLSLNDVNSEVYSKITYQR